MLGKNKSRITSHSLILCFIQIIVVVTSPMTVQAPPALAATTTMPIYKSRSSRSATSLRNTEIITMVVVKLSKTADRKNVHIPMTHSSDTLLLDLT